MVIILCLSISLLTLHIKCEQSTETSTKLARKLCSDLFKQFTKGA